MPIFMGRGEEAKKAIENSGGSLDLKKAFIRLKAGQSVRVRILTPYDYVAYKSHGHYSKGVFTQPCLKVIGERCLMCEAANYDGELVEKDDKGKSVWNPLYAKKRVLFGFVDLDEDMIRVFDATKKQADALIATIDEYADELDSLAFKLSRTGEKNETTYSLSPILPKKMKDIQEVFDKWEGKTIEDVLFEEALQARTLEEQAKELQRAGFPVKDVLGIDVKVDENQNSGKEEAEPIHDDTPLNEDQLPF